jgi:Zn-dependent alcohol dehydrogenase
MPGRRTSRTRLIRAAVLRKPGGLLEIEQLQLEGPRDDEVLVCLVSMPFPSTSELT